MKRARMGKAMHSQSKNKKGLARTSSFSDVTASFGCGVTSIGEKGASREESREVGAAIVALEVAGGVGRGTLRGSSLNRRSSASKRVADTPVGLFSPTVTADLDLDVDSGSNAGSIETIEAEDELTSGSVSSIVFDSPSSY